MLNKVKLALRITTDVYNTEIEDLIKAAKADLQITDIYLSQLENDGENNPLIIRAIILYCKMYFGFVEDGEFLRLKKAYDELKAQLSMNSEFTKWDIEEEGDVSMEVDNILSLTSENPVQNKVITQAINDVKNDLSRADNDIATLNSDIVGINANIDSVVGNITSLNTNKQDKLTAGNGIELENNTISVSVKEEALIVGWTTISPNVYLEINFDNYIQYHRYTTLIYIRKGNNREAVKFELTKEEINKLISKAVTNELVNVKACCGVTNTNVVAMVKRTIQRPTQESTGLGIIRLKYQLYENGNAVNDLDNFEYCMYAE